MKTITTTHISETSKNALIMNKSSAGVLIASTPSGFCTTDRCVIAGKLTVGRNPGCQLCIRDKRISSRHFTIALDGSVYRIADLKSTNGTFLNGHQVDRRVPLDDQAIIRIGQTVMVFHSNVTPLLKTPPVENFGMAGQFHSSQILAELREASLSSRHVLVAGPSGTGKELAATALASLMSPAENPLSLLAFNAARVASTEEAVATLFGVAPRYFSNVDARPGLIEQSKGGVLFIDEVHNLPERSQRSLLRVIEENKTARLGETKTRPTDVRLILASNVEDQTKGLAHDLFARLRLVEIPPLTSRIADIPDIFNALLSNALQRCSVSPDEVLPLLNADHYEALCLDGFTKRNVRGLADLSDRIATRIRAGAEPDRAATEIFQQFFADSPVNRRSVMDDESSTASRYESNKDLIINAYRQHNENISATERHLKTLGFKCSRRWIAIFLEKWKVR